MSESSAASRGTVTSSWYRNDDGQIYILSPWRLVDFWTWTQAPDLDDYVLD